MSSKIDIRRIIEEHISTLRKQNEESVDYVDILTFYGFPALIALSFYVVTEKLKADSSTQVDSVLVSAFSVFAALLLNAQVLIIGLLQKKRLDSPAAVQELPSPEDVALTSRTNRITRTATSELFVNISYSIIVSVLLVTFTLVILFLGLEQSVAVKAIQFFGVSHFCLTILMILKRLHVVFLTS